MERGSQEGIAGSASGDLTRPPWYRRLTGPRQSERPAGAAALAATRWGSYHRSYAEVAAFFDRWAEGRAPRTLTSRGYERDAHAGYLAPALIAAQLLKLLPPRSRVLDLGCGTGLAGKGLIAAGHRLTGVDISPAMARKALAKGYEGVRIADLTVDVPPWQREFDAALCVGVLGDWIPATLLLPRLMPMLRPRAAVGLTLERSSERLATSIELLRDAGFRSIRHREGLGFRKAFCARIYYHYVIAIRNAPVAPDG